MTDRKRADLIDAAEKKLRAELERLATNQSAYDAGTWFSFGLMPEDVSLDGSFTIAQLEATLAAAKMLAEALNAAKT